MDRSTTRASQIITFLCHGRIEKKVTDRS